MYPVLIKIGPVTIHTYGFLIATAFLVALWFAVRQAKKTGISHEKVVDLGFYILVSAIVGSRFFFIITNWSFYKDNLLNILKIWEGGLVFYGGVILAVPTAIWYLKKQHLPVWKTADIWAPSIAIGHAIGRLGCFSAGCCYGRPAEGLPWAVTFRNPESLAIINVPLHPTQIYEAGAEFLNFLILVLMRRRQSFNGQLFWIYIMNYSIIRSVIEIFRGDESRGFIFNGVSTSQGVSVLMFIVAIVMMVRLKNREHINK